MVRRQNRVIRLGIAVPAILAGTCEVLGGATTGTRFAPVSAVSVAWVGGPPTSQPAGEEQETVNQAVTGPLKAAESAALRGHVREAMDSYDWKTAERLLRHSAQVKDNSERQAWLLLEAEFRCHTKEYARAGLAAMRVVVLYPAGERTGAASYWAGRAYEGLGRGDKAADLYRACLDQKQTDAAVRRRAEVRLAALTKKGAQ